MAATQLPRILEYLAATIGKVSTQAHGTSTGLLLDGTLFGLVSDDKLFFRVDRQTRADYEAFAPQDDGAPFMPPAPRGVHLNYMEVPIAVQTDPEELGLWAKKAWECAKRQNKMQ
jgi:DNA transformation protein